MKYVQVISLLTWLAFVVLTTLAGAYSLYAFIRSGTMGYVVSATMLGVVIASFTLAVALDRITILALYLFTVYKQGRDNSDDSEHA